MYARTNETEQSATTSKCGKNDVFMIEMALFEAFSSTSKQNYATKLI
jgi:hypothetical protein